MNEIGNNEKLADYGLAELGEPNLKQSKELITAMQSIYIQGGAETGTHGVKVLGYWIRKLTGMTEDQIDSLTPGAFLLYQTAINRLTEKLAEPPTKKK